MEQMDENADGREIELTPGQEFELTLAENPTTGFRWRVTADGSPACALVKDEFRAPDEGRPGQGGSHVWQFRADRAGQGRIEMSYARAAGEASRNFTLSVRVKG
ncbi:MAG TPA: protease inhibitor I42 family protein [Pyrinomonadaceae bacterium]|jgi:inhibitor of cysteine peptidase|nr:protease inhibitor I42 family protein [Pyrinomonadaceae bacterium]